jgi:hypothetical protein
VNHGWALRYYVIPLREYGEANVRLGQKQTYAVQNVMSALPPKADMCGALVNVR